MTKKVYTRYVPSNEKDYEHSRIFPTCKQGFRCGGNSQPVTNFPGSISKFIVTENFKHIIKLYNCIPGDNYSILDTSCGWGGRLLGVLGSFTQLRKWYKKRFNRELHVTYIGTDPNQEVDHRFKDVNKDWFTQVETPEMKKYFHFQKDTTGSETSEFLMFCKKHLKKYHLDGFCLCLVSPPYFNREMYSEDDGQSFRKFKKYPLWRDGFLRPTIQNVEELLIPGARFYLNIADVKKGTKLLPLEDDSIKFGLEVGFTLKNTYKMLLQSPPGKFPSKNTILLDDINKKFEPIFIFEKKYNIEDVDPLLTSFLVYSIGCTINEINQNKI